MLSSYHVHTVWSDGQCGVGDMIEAAVKAGLQEVGISDHYGMTPEGNVAFPGMPLDSIKAYMEDLRASSQKYESRIAFRFGIEFDYFPETSDFIRDTLATHCFDYVIGSVHTVGNFTLDNTADDWEPLTQDQINNMVVRYWEIISEMAKSRLFDIAGHLDLYKKFAYLPSIDMTPNIEHAIDDISASDMAVELNTAGWHKDIKEQYPSADILRMCYQRSIPVVVTADAHHCSHIARDFDRAYGILKEIGFNSQPVFERRICRMEPF